MGFMGIFDKDVQEQDKREWAEKIKYPNYVSDEMKRKAEDRVYPVLLIVSKILYTLCIFPILNMLRLGFIIPRDVIVIILLMSAIGIVKFFGKFKVISIARDMQIEANSKNKS